MLTFQLISGVGFIAKILQILHLCYLRKLNFCDIICNIKLLISEQNFEINDLISELLNFIGFITWI